MGEPRERRALDAWAEDSTRLPRHLQAENLRNLYLQNDFAEGRFLMGGRPVALRDIDREMFVLGTEFDHIAPWRSVYKFLLLCDTDITFALTNRGHNVGVVSPPGGRDRHFRVRRQASRDGYLAPDGWFAETSPTPGSWWLLWFEWLKARSGAPVPPPPCVAGAGLGDAPGRYVLER
jgi:polyhydroxyalkanoate synthase